jgi:diguanylate cyclase (GGDEF)-like protein
MRWFKTALFGAATFGPGKEFLRFQYSLSCAILLASALIILTLHLAALAEQAAVNPIYLWVLRGFLALNLLFYALLRDHPERLMPLARAFLVISSLFNGATLALNPTDELRIIWFLLNLPPIYLVMGLRVGDTVAAASAIFIVAVNPYLPEPYSRSAIATYLMGLADLSLLFRAFTARSVSFHHSMIEANRQLAEMATRDPLTGVLNARGYYATSDSLINLARRGGKPFSVLFIDLDHFKKVNDTHGHEAGDAVLREVAACLRQNLRESDLVGRIGGEEFSVFLPDTDLSGATRLAEKLRADIEARMPETPAGQLRVTASIGVAQSPHGNATMADIQRQADQAMYEAKRQGRNRVTAFS